MPDLSALQMIIGFLLLLTPVVFIHELGHYWAARRAGVFVEVFSIGFGPEIFGWTSKSTGTRWRFAAIPLGGYVRMRGDDNAASAPREGADRMKGSFAGASLTNRILIVAAGPVVNFILGILLYAGVYMTVGKSEIPAEINEVIPGAPAAVAGLLAGDLVTEIEGVSIRNFNDIARFVAESPERSLIFTVKRHGNISEFTVTPKPRFIEEYQINIGFIGIKSKSKNFERLLPGSAVVAGTSDAFYDAYMILRGLARLGKGQMQAGEVQGPIGIAKISGSVMVQGVVPFILLTALISINLGLINLLPIPALDGGHLAFFFYEAIAGRPLPLAAQAVLMRIGMTLLLTLMIVVTFFDLDRWFG